MLCPNRGGLLKKTQYSTRSKKLRELNSPYYQFTKPKEERQFSLEEEIKKQYQSCYKQNFIFFDQELVDEPGVENCWVHLSCVLW